MDKRAIIFLAVGVICAGVVVVAASQFMQGSEEKKKEPDSVKVLVAAQKVDYGTAISLPVDGEKGNVGFMSWPKKFVPEDAVTDAKMLKEKDFVAVDSFVRYEPVLKNQLIEKEEFIPEDMLPRRISVDPKDVKVGLLKAGMRVDIYKDYKKFMECVRIASMGDLRYNQSGQEDKKKEEPASHAYVLIKRDQMVEFEKASDSGRLKVFPCEKECAGGPVLTSELAGAKGRAAGDLLKKGTQQVGEGSIEEAIKTFQTVTQDYSGVAPAVEKANTWLDMCQTMLAERVYLQAQEAFINGDYATTDQLVETLVNEHPEAGETLEKAKELQEVAQRKAKQSDYEKLLADIRNSLNSGNFPQTEKLLKEELQTKFVEAEFKPDKSTMPPQQAMQRYMSDLERGKRAFDNAIRIFKTLRRTGNVQRARQKYQEITQRFPQHPYVNNQMTQMNQNQANN